ncbi:MAG: hypothetical protein L3J08_00795 [Flavobacteriaceae bacterium]|nr:hypothetical protein [Flavobacteriaceae bacterium]
MAENKQNQEDEIDLGNLFKIIGKGIKSLFNAIGDFFLNFFHYFILLLIFLKKNILKIGLAVILGAALGYFLEYDKPEEYSSNLIVETNYNSGIQLYKQIDYLSNLVSKKDTISLAKALQISTTEASQIRTLEVMPHKAEKNLFKLYDEYLKKINDTLFTKGLEIEIFKKRLNQYDYNYQEVFIKSNSKFGFNKISMGLKILVENEYFKRNKEIRKKQLNSKLAVLQKNLIQIDSLRSLYKKVKLKEAGKPSSSTTLEISQKVVDNNINDITLFNTSNEILAEIESLNSQILRSNNILNFISNFEEAGVIDKKVMDEKYFHLAVLFGSVMLLIILLLQLNSYLSNYKK